MPMPFVSLRRARVAVRTLTVVSALMTGLVTLAQAQGAPVRASGSVSGIVYDSLAAAPLRGAEVQLVNADSLSQAARTMTTDSLGRYVLTGVPRGRYLLGFLHPVLDSLGIEPKPREVITDGVNATRADLAIPAPARLRAAICPPDAQGQDDALIMGFVRRARDREPVDSAVVRVQWVEMTLQRGALSRQLAFRNATTPESGWYAVCGAPSAGSVLLRAARGADSTEALELEVPANGFLRRDLYFGSAQIAAADTANVAKDSLALALGVRRTGDGRLTGMVVGQRTNEPLAGARIGVVNGAQTRTDAAGRFTLTGLPTGTRMLEVRAVGRYPLLMPVDIVDGAPPLRIAMLTLQSVMDTVRVTAARGGNKTLLEFNERKQRSGSGRFITSEDVQNRRPTYTSDLFRSMPGVSVARDRNGEEFLAMRGSTTGPCRAAVFMNGMYLRSFSANDINGFARPDNVIGIEVYNASTAPGQFRDPGGCGSVVIWSR